MMFIMNGADKLPSPNIGDPKTLNPTILFLETMKLRCESEHHQARCFASNYVDLNVKRRTFTNVPNVLTKSASTSLSCIA